MKKIMVSLLFVLAFYGIVRADCVAVGTDGDEKFLDFDCVERVWRVGPSFSLSQSTPIRPLNTAFQISVDYFANVSYEIDVACNLSLSIGRQAATVYIDVSTSPTMVPFEVYASRLHDISGNLSIGFSVRDISTVGIWAFRIPPRYWVRLRTENTAETPIFTYRSGREQYF